VVVHDYNPNTWEVEDHEFKVNPDPVSKKQKTNKQINVP
jgi:hypothetical protein